MGINGKDCRPYIALREVIERGHNSGDRAGSSRSDAGVNLPAATKPPKKNSRGKRKRPESVSCTPFSTPVGDADKTLDARGCLD